MKRRSPFVIVAAIAAMLFAQAMASVHACDMVFQPMSPHASVAQDASEAQGQAPALAPDSDCANHCQQGDKAPDRAHVTSASAPIAAPLLISLNVATPALTPIRAATPYLARRIEPAIPIRNCCFRI